MLAISDVSQGWQKEAGAGQGDVGAWRELLREVSIATEEGDSPQQPGSNRGKRGKKHTKKKNPE